MNFEDKTTCTKRGSHACAKATAGEATTNYKLLMPLSAGPYGIIAFVILAAVVAVNEVIRYRKSHH